MRRREFISKFGAGIFGFAFLAGCSENVEVLPVFCPGKKGVSGSLRFGLMTDSHYADRDRQGSRWYRDSLRKTEVCVRSFNDQKLDFVIETGDFKDQGASKDEASTISYLRAIEGVFRKFKGRRYHVLGNHDMDSISKPQFLANIKNTGIDPKRTYYSFDIKGVHCIVLDANFNSDSTNYDHGNYNWTDANIPQGELDWLKDDLEATKGPAIVFVHQLLDGQGSHYVNNAGDVRRILEDSGKVSAVFQGHQHAGSYNLINGIHYYTLKAMCEGPFPENNAYAVVEMWADKICITGYGNVGNAEMNVKTTQSVSIKG